MGACIAHHAKCFEGEMSSRSGLHRDLRPQAAGARHLVSAVAPQGKAVKPGDRTVASWCAGGTPSAIALTPRQPVRPAVRRTTMPNAERIAAIRAKRPHPPDGSDVGLPVRFTETR